MIDLELIVRQIQNAETVADGVEILREYLAKR